MYRLTVSLKEVRKESAKLREDLQSVSNALKEHFQDILDDPDSPDSYPRLMFRFVRNATSEVASLTDRVTLAETSFSAVVTYFGAEESVSSEQFFGDLNTFVSSYRVSALLRAARAVVDVTHSVPKLRTTRPPKRRPRPSADVLHAKLHKNRSRPKSRRLRKCLRMAQSWRTYSLSCAQVGTLAAALALAKHMASVRSECRVRTSHKLRSSVQTPLRQREAYSPKSEAPK